MLTSTPDATRQLVADRHASLSAAAAPRRAVPIRDRRPARLPRRRWRAVAHLLAHRI